MTAKDTIQKLDKASNSLVKIGALLITLAIIICAAVYVMPRLLSSVTHQPDFEITGALAVDFVGNGVIAETVANLTYKGTRTVNVSYYYEFYRSDFGSGNQTSNVGVMSNGETREIGFYGRVTWCEIIYNGNKVKLQFEPKYYKVPDTP